MTQIFGEFSDNLPISQEYLAMEFSPSSIPLKQRWRTNGLSADFMADYFTTFFPGSGEASSGIDTQAEVKSAVSFIANELLENAMKYNDEKSSHPISIKLQLHQDKLVFLATNTVNPQVVEKFQVLIKELTTSDPSELYLQRLEKNTEAQNESGLGLLTMMNDYLAKLGWKFEKVQNDPETLIVTTMVHLTV